MNHPLLPLWGAVDSQSPDGQNGGMYDLLEIAFALIGPAAVMITFLARRPGRMMRGLLGTTAAVIAPIAAGWASYQDTLRIVPCRLTEEEAYVISCIGPHDAPAMADETTALVVAAEVGALCMALLILLIAAGARRLRRTDRATTPS